MSAGSIFDSESEKRGPNLTMVAIGVIAFVVLCGAANSGSIFTQNRFREAPKKRVLKRSAIRPS